MADISRQITDFDPARTRAIYDALSASWRLNRDFAEMHLNVLRRGEYLDEFGGYGAATSEAASQYAWRKAASLAMDHCADLINLRVDNIFRTPPRRYYGDSPYRALLDAFLGNVDGGGTDMTAFMRRSLPQYYINGVDFVVDKASPPDGFSPANLAQERELGLLPYVQAFGPLDRLDWSCDHAGRFLWARYDLGCPDGADERGDGGGPHRYLTVMTDQWRLYEVHDGDGGGRNVTVTRGEIALGLCPIVPFYYKESTRREYPRVPLSLLTRIAPIARYLLNLVSQIQIDVYRNIAFLVATGVEADKIPAEITPMGCWALPDGAELRDIAGDVDHIRVKIQFAQMLMEAILRIGKLTGGTGDLKSRAASGVQVAVERTDLDNEMRMTAHQAEQAEREIVRLAVSRHQGRLVPHDEIRYHVEYNKKYVLTPVADLIDQARQFVSMGVQRETPRLMRALLRKVLDAVVADDDKAYGEALAEIESATFALIGSAGSPED